MIRRACPVCGALMRNARHVTVADEEEANAHAPAAILDCTKCPSRVVLHALTDPLHFGLCILDELSHPRSDTP